MCSGSFFRASAQESRAYVDAGVSHARPPAGVDIDPATYLLLGARLFMGPGFASFYGAHSADGTSADWIGGALGAQHAASIAGRWGWGLTGVASAFSIGAPTPYKALTARLQPEAHWSGRNLAVVLRGYGGIGRSEVSSANGGLATDLVADLWMFGAGLEVRRPLGSGLLWLGGDAYHTAGGSYYSGFAGLVGSQGVAVWGLGMQLWETPDGLEPELNLRVVLPLGGRWSGEFAAGRSGPDPLLGSPAGVDGSVVVSWSALAPSPEPQSLVSLSNGDPATVTFRLEYDGADSVAVIGDFTDWTAVPLRRQGSDWIGTLPVEPGLYHFGFLVDGEWYVPDHAPGKVADEWGRWNATLVVTER